MADTGGTRRDVSTGSTPQRPVPMKLFATWEVERTSPNCVPRLCTMTLTRLELLKPLEPSLTEVIISVSMQSSRRTLRSNEIVLPSSGLIDTDLDLSFSLQYPHFLKRAGNNLQVMLQRRKKYKNRTILGFKTLAVGLVNMGQVLQHSVDNQLKLYMKGSLVPVAQVTVNSLTSQPVETDGNRLTGSLVRGDGDDNSSDDDDDFSLSDQEGSDSGGDAAILDVEQRQGGKIRHGKITIPAKHQKNFKQKFIALLKKFKVPEEEFESEMGTYPDIDISPPENETADDFLFPDDLEDLDSDAENDFLEDTISIVSTPKPSLRPYFDPRSSTENVPSHSLSDQGNIHCPQFSIQVEGEDLQPDYEMDVSPHSDGDNLSDITNSSDPLSGSGGVDDTPSVRRSVSFKERRKTEEPDTLTKRRNSDIDLQLPRGTLNEQLSNVLSGDTAIPECILLISTSEWQGQLLALKLCGKAVKMVCTRSSADVQAVFLAIINRYQKFINTHSASPPQLGVAIAGTESYLSAVVQPYVEHFSSKPPDWQTFLRFLLIPLDGQPLARHIGGLDARYHSLFMDNFWKEAFEHSDTDIDFEEVSRRVENLMSTATTTHNLPIAEALVNTKPKGSEEGSSQVFLPFVCDVKIGSADIYQDEEPVATSGIPTSIGAKSTGAVSRAESQAPVPGSSQTPPFSTSPLSGLQDSSGGSLCSSEQMDLQVDYWLAAGNKKDINKSSLKTTFKTLVVTRLSTPEESSALSVMAVTKERNKRGLEAMMRSMKKSKEKDTDSKNQPVMVNVSKLICTTKGQSSTLNVVIDGVTWTGVKFFSLSSQWPTHIKNFPIGLFGRTETTC
ncbi:phosphofurin acidic cluster sorting protein 2-like isoform X2 [Stylophora pistillata]|uniref:phosphofurin acidic cluster sorting protein 2-like isoform X2 n=1 Tax=Stylophora pistillata TaxID=50429 RepID=UPI000C044B15|nr:phosphofurin acidic cluster sorting protein 2-like isoform X2 [Stylophora pistillata]